MRIKDCDNVKLGLIMKRIPLSSLRMGHQKISATMKDYIIPGKNDTELEYVVDLFNLSTEEVIEKWFNGEDSANQLMAQLDDLPRK